MTPPPVRGSRKYRSAASSRASQRTSRSRSVSPNEQQRQQLAARDNGVGTGLITPLDARTMAAITAAVAAHAQHAATNNPIYQQQGDQSLADAEQGLQDVGNSPRYSPNTRNENAQAGADT